MEEQEKVKVEEVETEEETTKKKKIGPKGIFWIRFSLWTIFACICPVAFIIYRFDLFQPSGTTFGAWGLIALIIILLFIISIIKYVQQGMPYSMFAQCLVGVYKIILPLVIVLACVCALKDSMENCEQALACATACELVAIPINPLPKWAHEHNMKYNEGLVEMFWNKSPFKHKDKDEE